MADILHQFNIKASHQKIFDAFCTVDGLNNWWPSKSTGQPKSGQEYVFWFGPEYDWRGVVTHAVPGKSLTWKMSQASEDWMGTEVGFDLSTIKDGTRVSFFHKGWKEPNEHYAISSFCWASLLTGLKNYVEKGTIVPFEERQ